MPNPRPPKPTTRRDPRPSLTARIEADARSQPRNATVRISSEIEAREGVAIQVDGRQLCNFSGSDYLGLAQHPEVVAGLQESAAWLGVGTGLSHLSASAFRAQRELEDAVAQWQGYARGLMFGSAYVANLAVMQALLHAGDLCVQDRLNHGSLIDGARLAGAELCSYPHLAADGALRALRSRPDVGALLATHGIFALDGDMASLKMLAVLARTENASLYVDDAHGTGVIGPEGRGSVAMAGLGEQEVPLQLISLGRALGCAGAVLVGSQALIEQISETARAFLYSSPPPPALAVAAHKSLTLARTESWRRFKLAALVTRLRRGAQQLGIDLMDSATAIQPLLLGSSSATLAAARHLERAGFLVSAVRPPFVPDGRARLRITLSAAHEEHHVDALLEALADVARRVFEADA